MPLFRRRTPATATTDAAAPAHRGAFIFLRGRRHLEAPYPLPKDMGEVNRLDFQHYLLRNGFRGNFAAPLTQPQSILDVGTGTGRWAMELAQVYPQANVVGFDMAPPAIDDQALLGNGLDRRPDNYTFVQGNLLDGLPFADRNFDFVHQRLLITAIPKDRWPSIIADLTRVTRPGGWVELAEVGVPEHAGPNLERLWASWIAMCQKRNVDFTMGHMLGDLLQAAGLSSVTRRHVDFPMGAYGGRLGSLSATDCLATGEALRGPVVAMGILPEDEYNRLLTATRVELNAPTGTATLPFHLAFGQRNR